MKQRLHWLFPPLTIYNPVWTARLPTGQQQVLSLYGLVVLLSLFSGLAGAAFASYLPLQWLFVPVSFTMTASAVYRLYNLVLTYIRQALSEADWLSSLLIMVFMVVLSLLIAHIFALIVFQDVIRLAELRIRPAFLVNWQFFVDSYLLIVSLSELSIRLLWAWLQIVTTLLFIMPFLQLFFTRHNLHTHLHHVRQELSNQSTTATTRFRS